MRSHTVDIQFILNDKDIVTSSPNKILLDFIRYYRGLIGTKIGCREGDCGACTVLVGDIEDSQLKYESITSCLTPIGNVSGKHIVTIEGINLNKLTLVQQALVDQGGTQCGFCTVGFIVSLTGFCLNSSEFIYSEAIQSIDGNICRCTGYKSIERAARDITHKLHSENGISKDRIRYLIDKEVLPAYFEGIKDRLINLGQNLYEQKLMTQNANLIVAGGTDLYVQRPEEMIKMSLNFVNHNSQIKQIKIKGDRCYIGAGVTTTDILNSTDLQNIFGASKLKRYMKLLASTPIRNIATIGGNFMNASPIGDFIIFFLALDAEITLKDSKQNLKRHLPVTDFYLGYKEINVRQNELLESINFNILNKNSRYNFEKVSKRTHLDIASVNSAIVIEKTNSNHILTVGISAGGVAPVPLYLKNTVDYLIGKKITIEVIKTAADIAQLEISPISDARGSDNYKRLLLRQLFFSHFLTLFPNEVKLQELIS